MGPDAQDKVLSEERVHLTQEPSTRQWGTSSVSRYAGSLVRWVAPPWVVLGKKGFRCLLGTEPSLSQPDLAICVRSPSLVS